MSELPNLNNLEFENLKVSRGEKPEVSNSKDDIKEDEILIDYSSGVVASLEMLMKEHNKECGNKVSLNELKEVFRNGANCVQAQEAEIQCGVLALARVNMFLRLKSGEIMEACCISDATSLDISDLWYPSELDFSKAKELAQEYNLNHEFKDVSNLYLEEYTELELEWE
jgi:hypothetical protein